MNPKHVQREVSVARAKEYCVTHWGWTTPDDTITRIAQYHLYARGKRLKTLEVMVDKGIISENTKARVLHELQNNPDAVTLDEGLSAFEAIGSRVVTRNEIAEYKNELLSIEHDIMYIPLLSKDHITAHPAMQSDHNIQLECKNMNAVLVKIQEKTSALLFSDLEGPYRTYVSLGRIERQLNPIVKRFVDSQERLVIGSARQDEIAKMLNESTSDASDVTARMRVNNLIDSQQSWESKLGRIYAWAISRSASDIHFAPKEQDQIINTHVRIHGMLVPVPEDLKPTREEYHRIKITLLARSGATKTTGEILTQPEDGHLLLNYENQRVNLRLSFIPDGNMFTYEENFVDIVQRVIPYETDVVNPATLGFEERLSTISQLIRFGQGLVLVTGPTGSGKSRTTYGMIELYKQEHGDTKKIVTFEKPVERDIPGVTQINIRLMPGQEPGTEYEPYDRQILRQDPDMIGFGEINDSKTALSAAKAVQTGHFCLATLHTNSAEATIERLEGLVPDKSVSAIISCISGIIAQRLVPILCDKCVDVRVPTADERSKIKYALYKRGETEVAEFMKSIPEDKQLGFLRSPPRRDCKCKGVGVTGRVPVLEILDLSPSQRQDIIKGGDERKNALEEARICGMTEQLIDLISNKQVDLRYLAV